MRDYQTSIRYIDKKQTRRAYDLFRPERLGSPDSVAAFLGSFLGLEAVVVAALSFFPGRPRFFFWAPSSPFLSAAAAFLLFVLCFLAVGSSASSSLSSASRLSPVWASSSSSSAAASSFASLSSPFDVLFSSAFLPFDESFLSSFSEALSLPASFSSPGASLCLSPSDSLST